MVHRPQHPDPGVEQGPVPSVAIITVSAVACQWGRSDVVSGLAQRPDARHGLIAVSLL